MAVLGAVGGVLLAALSDLVKDLRGRRYRWDEMTYTAFAEFAGAARAARDGAARYSRAHRNGQGTDSPEGSIASSEARAIFDELHEELRRAFDRMALVASPSVLQKARLVVRCVYALRRLAEQGVEPHNGSWNVVHSKLMVVQRSFYKRARKQLRIRTGDDPGEAFGPNDSSLANASVQEVVAAVSAIDG